MTSEKQPKADEAEEQDPKGWEGTFKRARAKAQAQEPQQGVCSRNGKNRTLSLGEHPERPKSSLLDQLVLPLDVVAGQVDVLPAQGRQMRQQLLIDVLPSVA